MTTLLTVEAMKFKALVVWMGMGSLSAGGTTVMGTVGAEMLCESACVASSRND